MQRPSTPTMSDTTTQPRRCQRTAPRRLTIERLRQFARAYAPATALPAPLAGIVLN